MGNGIIHQGINNILRPARLNKQRRGLLTEFQQIVIEELI